MKPMKALFAVKPQTLPTDLALLLARLFMGYAFILHGWGKIQNPFGWMPGAPVPGFLQALAALSEFGGGIVLILGLVTRLGALGLSCTMAVAAWFHLRMMGDPLVSMAGERSAEPATTFLMLALLFLALGPGRFSLDRLLFGLRR
jgi:putative oxidoreductase